LVEAGTRTPMKNKHRAKMNPTRGSVGKNRKI
jgi:hypothetical protein